MTFATRRGKDRGGKLPRLFAPYRRGRSSHLVGRHPIAAFGRLVLICGVKTAMGSQTKVSSPSAASLVVAVLVLAFAAPARPQESHPAQSVVEAARNAREHKTNSTKHPKIITNADLGEERLAASDSALQPPSTNGATAPNPSVADCDNPESAGLKMELQAARQELDRVRSELSYQPKVISGNDLDLQYFKPGNSGFYVGAPPLLDAQPPNATLVTQAELEEKIEGLKSALRLACEPPEAASIQSKLDRAEQQLGLLQREFALDRDAYYSRPDYTEDTAGKARLDAELQQIQSLQSEVDRLRNELAAVNPPQVAT